MIVKRIFLASLMTGGLAMLAVTGALPPAAAVPQEAPRPSGTLWVTNISTNDVAVFDAATGDLIATIPVGTRPIGIQAPPDTGKVYVANERSNTVSVISKSSLSVVATIPTGPLPHHTAQSSDGKFVYVAEFGTNKIGVIDTATDTLIAEFVTGPPEARTHAPWVTQEGQTLLAANQGVNQVAALDARTGAVKWTLNVGNTPSDIVTSPSGKIGFVSLQGEDKVKLLDLETPAILGEIGVGPRPATMQLSPTGRWVVVSHGGSPAQIAIIDVEGRSVTPMMLSGTGTQHNAMSQSGHFSYVAVLGTTPGVAVVDLTTQAVVAFYPYPGGGSPHGVFFEPTRLCR
jgi:YVTN family beta-propeller protein